MGGENYTDDEKTTDAPTKEDEAPTMPDEPVVTPDDKPDPSN